MHRMMRRWLTGLVLGAAALPMGPVSAQDNSELERRVDAAVLQRNAATAVLNAYRQRTVATRVYRVYPDTVAILNGALRIVTSREFLSIVRDAGSRAEAFIRQRAGDQASLLSGTVLTVWTDSVRRAEHGLIVSPLINGREINDVPLLANASSVTRWLQDHAQRLLVTRGKPRVETWLGGGLPIDSATNSEWRDLRLELVSSQAAVARRCFSGDLMACKVTLGLHVEADPPTAWYDSAQRRALVADARKSERIDRRVSTACVAGHDAECIALMRTSSILAFWSAPPGSTLARMMLVQVAFDMGDQGGLARLAGSNDTASEAVSAIAGVPLDSVVAKWQRQVHSGGIESEIATPIVALAAVGWVLVLCALSLRSPRWR